MTRNRLCTAMALALVCCTTVIVSLRVFAGGSLAVFFDQVSLTSLPAAERRLIEFLLLLPVAALVICAFRNLIGLTSFGTFAPALIGLVFRDWQSLPGLSVFVGLLVIGWMMRRASIDFTCCKCPAHR